MDKLKTGISTNLAFKRKLADKEIDVSFGVAPDTLRDALSDAGSKTVTFQSTNETVLSNLNEETEPAVPALVVAVPEDSKELYGKQVSELVSDLAISEDGKVTGTFNRITDYTGFSGLPAEQSGYFFPFTISDTGTTMTFTKNGAVTKDEIPFEADNVFRIVSTDIFKVTVDNSKEITFTFEGATFNE